MYIYVAGIDDGQTLRINVGGEEIFVTVAVQASRYFTREGNDVHTDVTISVAQAVLGGTLRVQGVYDDLNLDVRKAFFFVKQFSIFLTEYFLYFFCSKFVEFFEIFFR